MADTSEVVETRSDTKTSQVVEESKTPKTSPTRITVTPPKKEKDPKRVAQGKRLAAISKEAKERKLREKIEAEKLSQQYFDYTNLQKYIFLVASPAVVFLGLYLLWNNRKTKTVENLQPVVTRVPSSPPKPAGRDEQKKHISLFD